MNSVTLPSTPPPRVRATFPRPRVAYPPGYLRFPPPRLAILYVKLKDNASATNWYVFARVAYYGNFRV